MLNDKVMKQKELNDSSLLEMLTDDNSLMKSIEEVKSDEDPASDESEKSEQPDAVKDNLMLEA